MEHTSTKLNVIILFIKIFSLAFNNRKNGITINKKNYNSYCFQNFWDKAWWFFIITLNNKNHQALSQKFVLLSLSSLLYSQRFGRCFICPSLSRLQINKEYLLLLNIYTRSRFTELEQSTLVNSMKGLVRNSVRTPDFYMKHLKKGEGYTGRNVVIITINSKTIVQIFWMIEKAFSCFSKDFSDDPNFFESQNLLIKNNILHSSSYHSTDFKLVFRFVLFYATSTSMVHLMPTKVNI